MVRELQIISYPVQLANFDISGAVQGNLQRVIACPTPPAEAVVSGVAIAVPAGEFDAGVILDQLPAQFEPEIIHMSARNLGFKPLNLSKFRCPKVMKLGDTNHWGNGSLTEMIEYCKLLNSDFHWIYQGVQHLHFFQEAGVNNIFWLPGSIVLTPYVPEQGRPKIYDICFRGTLSNMHIYRQKLVESLQGSHFNIDIAKKSYQESLDDYAQSHIVFNCSGGGDFNRRVFEVLMAGGFLLTDRLSPQSGLSTLFQEGVHLDCYGSPGELVDKVNYYLKNPQKAEEIAQAGHHKFHQDYCPKLIKEKLHRFIFQGELESPFQVQHDRRFFGTGQSPSLTQSSHLDRRLKLYEAIQSISHLNNHLKLLYWQPHDPNAVCDLADLPRLQVICAVSPEDTVSFSSRFTQMGLSDQIHLITTDEIATSEPIENPIEIIIVDCFDAPQLCPHDLNRLVSRLAENGIIVLIGASSSSQKNHWNQIFRMEQWEAIIPIEINSHRPILDQAALIYRKKQSQQPASHSELLNLVVQPKKTWKTAVKSQLKSILRKSSNTPAH